MEIGGNIERTILRQRSLSEDKEEWPWWKEALIKYVCRVLKSFLIPNLDSTQNDLSNEVMLEEITMDKIKHSTLFQSVNQENQRS